MAQTMCEDLADYAKRASWERIPVPARIRLKQHLLDALGCALGAMNNPLLQAIRAEQEEFPSTGPCSLIGGGTALPERAAFYNGALVGYLDYMDAYLAPEEACHPSDAIASLLAAGELARSSGRDFLTAMAVAYHVTSRLIGSNVPIMPSGFDHTMPLAVAIAAGTARLLNMLKSQTANAIAICTASGLSMGATHTGRLSQWKGLASAASASQAIHNVRLAQYGVTGPLQAFEGPMGARKIFGRRFPVRWCREGYDAILRCNLKRYDAEAHAQSCIEGLLELRQKYRLHVEDVRRLHVAIFKAGYEMIGSGIYSDPQQVETREQADHSLPYLLAVALKEGEVTPAQFTTVLLHDPEIHDMMPRISVSPNLFYSFIYPYSMSCKLTVTMKNGQIFERRKRDYLGFYRRPMPWEGTVEKFRQLAGRSGVSEHAANTIVNCVRTFEERSVADLMKLLRCSTL